jgi:hypothetical protein
MKIYSFETYRFVSTYKYGVGSTTSSYQALRVITVVVSNKLISGVDSSGYDTPCLGDTWSHCCSHRIVLSRHPSRDDLKIAKMIKSPVLDTGWEYELSKFQTTRKSIKFTFSAVLDPSPRTASRRTDLEICPKWRLRNDSNFAPFSLIPKSKQLCKFRLTNVKRIPSYYWLAVYNVSSSLSSPRFPPPCPPSLGVIPVVLDHLLPGPTGRRRTARIFLLH